ncbi:hypothetical protein [Pseudonocardia parietis]|uniref:DUF2892 domain-containing protein n=1 Tax=Pseudonocardia parietis TaxID=570936 RepID=A0ABS4VVM6_9PSEU|nr:hypothetical protein [Pseudonocardia parietis]MBP2367967.1 hypothetical protein [Pseudonocardia parietis]
MNIKARIQAWSTLVVALSLPLLYLGGVHHSPSMSLIGVIVFAAGLLTCPALRFIRLREQPPPAVDATGDTKPVP